MTICSTGGGGGVGSTTGSGMGSGFGGFGCDGAAMLAIRASSSSDEIIVTSGPAGSSRSGQRGHEIIAATESAR
jgi:hypothetical protein